MGYRTMHTLSADTDNEKFIIIVKELWEFSEEADFALDENGDAATPAKWYDNEDDLVEFSQKYPDIVFTLEGEGEESGDIWKKYFKNGEKQIAHTEIKIDEYDESKLV